MSYVALFFAGAFLCNSLPHVVAGLQGTPFPTPFARPRGVGNSSPLVNFLWGALNLAIGLFLLSLQPVAIGPNADCYSLVAGAILLGIHLARHFGRVRGRAS